MTTGIDAAMKVARSAAIAGCGGTSNVAAAMRYGLRPWGPWPTPTCSRSTTSRRPFAPSSPTTPSARVLLVDTYDTLEGVRNAIAASRDTGIALTGVRLDSGDLPSSRARRAGSSTRPA